MRLFVGVQLPEKTKIELDKQLSDVRKQYPEFEWVAPDNFHITIHFFGEIQDIAPIKKKLADILFDQESFYLYSREIEVFANHKLTIYLNFRREKKLEELARVIEENFEANRYSQLKFVPHLTIARARRSSKQQYFVLKKRMEKINIDVSFPVKKITLLESVMSDRKPQYNKVSNFPLL